MRRRGVILIEVIVACGLAAVLLAICVQVLTLMAVERRAVERRAIALQEAANLIEQATAIPFDQLTPQKLKGFSIDPALAAILPDAKAELSTDDEHEPLRAKRVAVAISWRGAGRRREMPVRLTTWVFGPAAKPTDGATSVDGTPSPSEMPAVIPPASSPPTAGAPTADQPAPPGPAVIPPSPADESTSSQSGDSP
jgi:hypothetical protein